MSATVKEVDDKVRGHMNDPDTGTPAFGRSVVRAKINSCLLGTVASKLHLGQTFVSGALAIDSSNDTYSLPSTYQYQMIRQFRLQGRGRELDPIGYERMMTRRNNLIDPSRYRAFPMEIAMWEQPDQTVKVLLYPWPNEADAIDIMQSLLPVKVEADDDVIPLDQYGIEGLAYDTASELVWMANVEKLTRLRLSRDVAPVYEKKRDMCLRASRTRGDNLHSVGQGHSSSRRRG